MIWPTMKDELLKSHGFSCWKIAFFEVFTSNFEKNCDFLNQQSYMSNIFLLITHLYFMIMHNQLFQLPNYKKTENEKIAKNEISHMWNSTSKKRKFFEVVKRDTTFWALSVTKLQFISFSMICLIFFWHFSSISYVDFF